MKKVRRGSYSLPARVVICKLTHHVNSALHVPQQKGGISSARSTATLALCQRHARHALAGTDGKDSWILMIGAANADSKYSHEYLHGQAEWRQHVAGRLLACAKADQLLRPEQAKAKFSRYRADTGIKFLHSALLFVCAAIFVLSAMLPRRKGKSACCWPKRCLPRRQDFELLRHQWQRAERIAHSNCVRWCSVGQAQCIIVPHSLQELPTAAEVLVAQLPCRPTAKLLTGGDELTAARSAIKHLMQD